MKQEKMKRLAASAVALCSITLFIGGCSPSTPAKTTASSTDAETVQADNTVIVNGLELSVDQFEQKTMVDEEGKEQTVFSAHVTGMNVSGGEKGLGAIDFVLTTTDDKEHEVTADLASFGNSLDSGETIEGDLYFSVEDKETPKTIAYKPADDALYTWDIK
jgi:hypothetical protein